MDPVNEAIGECEEGKGLEQERAPWRKDKFAECDAGRHSIVSATIISDESSFRERTFSQVFRGGNTQSRPATHFTEKNRQGKYGPAV
jgi:hypothetical protein